MNFNRLDPKRRAKGEPGLLNRKIPVALRDHREAAKRYVADVALVDAVNVALALGAPLLVTGKPGTGKTQLAYYCAEYFGVELHRFFVKSTSKASDVTYHFDTVGYFGEAAIKREPGAEGKLDKTDFLEKGPLWEAFIADQPCVVLIDEIDKASRDFPNDLLNVLDQHTFIIKETGKEIRCKGSPPLVILTSNSERRLPEPFLRRCVFHHIELDDALVARVVQAHKLVAPPLAAAAQARFVELLGRELIKPPSPSELLAWLAALDASGVTDPAALDVDLKDLPCLSALVKDKDDLANL